MPIYLLQRIGGADFDEVEGMVIVADNEKRARYLANQNTGDEGPIWTDHSEVCCTQIDLETEKIILTSIIG